MSNRRTDRIVKLAGMFKALSNPQRLRIFVKLLKCCGTPGCCESEVGAARPCVGELGGDLGVTESTVSHHVKELCRSGLMRVERRGKRIVCSIGDKELRRLSAFFEAATGGDVWRHGGRHGGRAR